MKKALIAIVVILVLAGIGAYVYMHNQAKAPSTTGQPQADSQYGGDQNQPSPVPGDSGTNVTGNLQASTSLVHASSTFSSGDNNNSGSNIQVTEVDFDGSQFTPATVNIKAGDWVFFKNKSTVNFWPASNPHPQHTDYPGFDALQPLAPGATYKFQFTKVGSWGYHDHLHAGIRGVVNVSQ